MIRTIISDIGNVLSGFTWYDFYKSKGYSEEMVERLAKATVKTGDVVAAGDAIATSGSTGFTKGNSLHVGLTVFGVPVCPYDLWENPIAFK